jgi:hypothetical protein
MKLAVFQVCEAGSAARLVCLEMSSLQSAANLEHWLRMNADPTTDITLLGRFDNVCLAMNEEEAELFSLTNTNPRQTSAPPVEQSHAPVRLEAWSHRRKRA